MIRSAPVRLPRTRLRQGRGLLLLIACAVPAFAQRHAAPIVRQAPSPTMHQAPVQRPENQYPQTGALRGQPYAQPRQQPAQAPQRFQGYAPNGYPDRYTPGYPYAGSQPARTQAGQGERGFTGQPPYGGPYQQPQSRGAGNTRPADPGQFTPNRPGRNQQHLGSWMNSHQNQPLDQQQRALEQEPGFHQLAPEQQQRMRNRLTELNRMDPQQRQSMIDRTEAMARLSPQQRQQVRSAAGELGSLPPNRQRAVAQAFRGLQSMPPDQRQSYMNSPQFRQQFTDGERGTLNNLMQVSPYLPMRQPQSPR